MYRTIFNPLHPNHDGRLYAWHTYPCSFGWPWPWPCFLFFFIYQIKTHKRFKWTLAVISVFDVFFRYRCCVLFLPRQELELHLTPRLQDGDFRGSYHGDSPHAQFFGRAGRPLHVQSAISIPRKRGTVLFSNQRHAIAGYFSSFCFSVIVPSGGVSIRSKSSLLLMFTIDGVSLVIALQWRAPVNVQCTPGHKRGPFSLLICK